MEHPISRRWWKRCAPADLLKLADNPIYSLISISGIHWYRDYLFRCLPTAGALLLPFLFLYEGELIEAALTFVCLTIFSYLLPGWRRNDENPLSLPRKFWNDYPLVPHAPEDFVYAFWGTLASEESIRRTFILSLSCICICAIVVFAAPPFFIPLGALGLFLFAREIGMLTYSPFPALEKCRKFFSSELQICRSRPQWMKTRLLILTNRSVLAFAFSAFRDIWIPSLLVLALTFLNPEFIGPISERPTAWVACFIAGGFLAGIARGYGSSRRRSELLQRSISDINSLVQRQVGKAVV